MAITAWLANVETSSICFSVNGRTVTLAKLNTPIGMPSRISFQETINGSVLAAAR
jgi:hypothetical protein